jgi:hypothetical protein
VWNRIAERLPLPNIVDFLLQRERIELHKRKTEKHADASVEHSESLTKSMLDLFWRSLDGCGVGGCSNVWSWVRQATKDRLPSLRYRRL